jgi:DNA-binding CsgD family transcriptional regulator
VLGVTVRESEVFLLPADRMGDKAIAARLHISPRTVEKHEASLITTTSRPDREALSTYAAALA